MLNLDEADQVLVQEAHKILLTHFEVDRHHVGAALRAKSGKIYSGVHIGSLRHINMCAEQVAIAIAVMSGEREFNAIVAVGMMKPGDEPRIVSPCGICREVISAYSPSASVILIDRGQVLKMKASELLPAPYVEEPRV